MKLSYLISLADLSELLKAKKPDHAGLDASSKAKAPVDHKKIKGKATAKPKIKGNAKAAPKKPKPEDRDVHKVTSGQACTYRCPETGKTLQGQVHSAGDVGATIINLETGKSIKVHHGHYAVDAVRRPRRASNGKATQ